MADWNPHRPSRRWPHRDDPRTPAQHRSHPWLVTALRNRATGRSTRVWAFASDAEASAHARALNLDTGGDWWRAIVRAPSPPNPPPPLAASVVFTIQPCPLTPTSKGVP